VAVPIIEGQFAHLMKAGSAKVIFFIYNKCTMNAGSSLEEPNQYWLSLLLVKSPNWQFLEFLYVTDLEFWKYWSRF
jgi:hypothetical protein